MTYVEYVEEGCRHKLTVQGHAGAAPIGQDLVCCAVSTLVQTLAQRVLDLYSDGQLDRFPVTELSADGSCIKASSEERTEILDSAYKTVLTGLQTIAMQWPQYVRVNSYKIIPGTG